MHLQPQIEPQAFRENQSHGRIWWLLLLGFEGFLQVVSW
jgi:hypothetical protein